MAEGKKKTTTTVLAVIGGVIAILLILALIRGREPAGAYKGRILIAGMGGHLSDANVSIDPTDTENPIKIPSYAIWTGDKLHMIDMGPDGTYGSHDVRVDNKDKTIAYWSTIEGKANKVLYGKVNLTTNTWVAEKASDIPQAVIDFKKALAGPYYCASGQSPEYHLPIWMGYPPFIDVIDKKTLDIKHRVFLNTPDFPANVKFTHGTNSPDFKYMFLIQGEVDPKEPFSGAATGVSYLYLLDMDALTKGQIKVVKKASYPGAPSTVAFRQTYTSDGKYILQSGKDKALIIKADDLTIAGEVPIAGVLPEKSEIHDVLATPDNKYAIATVRVITELGAVQGKKAMDGQLQLIDLAAKKLIGKPLSICKHCHIKSEKHFPLTTGLAIVGCTRCHRERTRLDTKGDAALCGMDAVWR